MSDANEPTPHLPQPRWLSVGCLILVLGTCVAGMIGITVLANVLAQKFDIGP